MDIDPSLTFREFSNLSGKPVDEIMEIYKNTVFFRDYESGEMSDEDFRQHIREGLNIESSGQEIDDAWNAMLIDIPENKMTMLKDAKKDYRTFLLSNTNNIHRKKFEQFFANRVDNGGIHDVFEKVYYSYNIKLRKPDPVIFKYVLDENNLNPLETLLIDDNQDNIEAARSSGIRVLKVMMNEPIIQIPDR